jgi:hypothetical protein
VLFSGWQGGWGSINFSSATTPLVSAKISYPYYRGLNGSIAVADYGTTPVRYYSGNVRQDGVWHTYQGPYNRRAGSKVAVKVYFNNNNHLDACTFSMYP